MPVLPLTARYKKFNDTKILSMDSKCHKNQLIDVIVHVFFTLSSDSHMIFKYLIIIRKNFS